MRKCKICDSEMLPLKKVIKNITYYDFKCHEELMSHLFIERVLNDKVIILKARLSSEEEDIVFKIDFDNPRTLYACFGRLVDFQLRKCPLYHTIQYRQ